MIPVVLLLLLLAGSAASAQAPSASERSLAIPRVATPPTLEDYLDGTPRPDEVAITTFVQREPGDGVPASQPTEAYLSYDADHLYVVFIARDREPGRVRASLTRREGFGNNDWVGLMLDTFQDRRRAYLFIVNPLGHQASIRNRAATGDGYGSARRVCRTELPVHSVRRLHAGPLPRCRRAGVRDRQRRQGRDRRQSRREGCVHRGPDAEPRLQPGRIRRAAGHDQPALRGVLPREASVLHRERGLFRDADQPVFLTPHCRSAVRRAPHRQAGGLDRRRTRHGRSRAR
jgi:hypothetical protein